MKLRAERAIGELQELIRIDTSNPPGNEAPAARRVAGWLREAGLEPTVLESAPGRANVVARLVGDGSLPPLLLAGHLDVVGAEASAWEHPPFGAEIHQGYLFGRGAVDMKSFVVMAATVIRELRRAHVRLKRDVIFAAVADEEAGCDLGSRFLVERHPELVRAQYMLGEVGGFSMDVGGRRFYPVMVAEKGVAWLRAEFHGEPGHGSVPRPASAVLKLAAWVDRLGRRRLPVHVTAASRHLVETLASRQPLAAGVALRQLVRRGLGGFVLDHVLRGHELAPWFAAILCNTATPTVLRAGGGVNAIPGRATVDLDGRTLPGFSAADLVAELRATVGPQVTLKVVREEPALEHPIDTPLYHTLVATLGTHAPGAVVVPYLLPGTTDAKQFARLGTICYGFSPVQFPTEDRVSFGKLCHAHNERIPVSGFVWGINVLYDVARRFAAAG